MEEMIYMPDEIVLARMMAGLDIEFKEAMHYHDEGYDNDYGLPPHFEACVHLLSLHF